MVIQMPVLGAHRVLAVLQHAVCSQGADLPVLLNSLEPQAIIGPLEGHCLGPLFIELGVAAADCLNTERN